LFWGGRLGVLGLNAVLWYIRGIEEVTPPPVEEDIIGGPIRALSKAEGFEKPYLEANDAQKKNEKTTGGRFRRLIHLLLTGFMCFTLQIKASFSLLLSFIENNYKFFCSYFCDCAFDKSDSELL
jgi:hypothetical protein